MNTLNMAGDAGNNYHPAPPVESSARSSPFSKFLLKSGSTIATIKSNPLQNCCLSLASQLIPKYYPFTI